MPLYTVIVRDRVIAFCLFFALGALTFSGVAASRSSERAAKSAVEAVKNTDLIAQCTTPGTTCFNLAAEANKKRDAKAEALSYCVIETILDLPPMADRAARRNEILAGYRACVAREATVKP